jgi:hypothetical protein
MNRRPDTQPRIAPALVVACVALAVSLGGTGYAAFKLPAGSVGTAQLKKNAVTSPKVKDKSLLAADFKPGQLPAGAIGPKGDKGDAGAQGPMGAAGPAGVSNLQYVQAVSATDTASPKSMQVSCPAGKKVLGGGFAMSNGAKTAGVTAEGSPKASLDGWEGTATWPSGVFPQAWRFALYAVCATVAP